MKALVVTFDRLPAAQLACYGNEWMETPNFDVLASQSAVFEQHFAEIPGRPSASHPWWTGRFEYFSRPTEAASALQQIRASGVRTHLIAESLEGLPIDLFSNVEELSGRNGIDVAVDEVPFAVLVTRAIEVWKSAPDDEPFLLWLHSAGVPSPWLAPRFFAELFLNELEVEDESDPDEILTEDEEAEANEKQDELIMAAEAMLEQFAEDASLRDLVLSETLFAPDLDGDEELTDDPDTLQLLQRMSRLLFGGYVTLLDHWFGKLMSECPQSSSTLVVMSAASGQALGERDVFLPKELNHDSATELLDVMTRTPLMIRGDFVSAFGTRQQELVQPPDVAATLLEWFGVKTDGAPSCDGQSLLPLLRRTEEAGRDVVWHFSTQGEVAVRSRERLLRGMHPADVELDAEDSIGLLFRKPDDAWDLFNVAAQEPTEMQRLIDVLRRQLAERNAAHASNS